MDSKGIRLRELSKRGLRRLLAALPLLLPIAAPASDAVPLSGHSARLDYLYFEPNSGDSSGGHAALCIEGTCYHFQQVTSGTIRMHRTGFEQFDFDYRVLGNRGMRVIRSAVTDDTARRLRSGFDRHLVAQDREFHRLEAAVENRRLLERLIARSRGELLPGRGSGEHVAASGYFVRDQSEEPTRWWPENEPQSEALKALRERLNLLHGEKFLADRRATLLAEIEQLRPLAVETDETAPGIAERYRNLLSELVALEVMSAAPRPNPATLRRPNEVELILTTDEVAILKRFAADLESGLVQLVDSPRDDRGFPMLIGLARLAAIEESVRSGSLVVLDVFSEDAATVPAATVANHAETVALVREDRRGDFVRLRHAFFADEAPGEARLSMMESAANLWLEVDEALHAGAPLRLPARAPLPDRGAVRGDWPAPAFDPTELAVAWDTARDRERQIRTRLANRFPYDLVRRNCVTELFRILEAALIETADREPDRDAVRRESIERLGGYVEWRHGLNFVPVVSAASVEEAYRVVEVCERPSRRQLAVRAMRDRENPLRVALRESNVLTARAYERSSRDSLFLFFTDDAFFLRPLYGVANLAVGFGGTLGGLALLPVDGGDTLLAGLNGALFSLPELTMVSLRRGSYELAPRSWAELQ